MTPAPAHPLITPPVEKWLTALESGEYRQCRNDVKDGDSYCCLGVGANLFKPVTELTITTTAVRIMRENGINLSADGHDRCIDMNDVDHKSFRAIAAAIRANPDRFFRSVSP